jgi:hypothetical protein
MVIHALYASAVRSPSQNRHRLVGTLAAGLVLAVAPVAWGTPAHLEVTTDVEEDCPTEHELRRALGDQLGRDLAEDPTSGAAVRVRRLEQGALVVDVSVTTREGMSTRTLGAGGDTCRDLVRAAVLTIALALEKEAPPPAKPPPPVPPPDRDVARGERPLRSDRFVTTVSAATAVGLLPRPGAGAGAAARIRVSEALWISGRGLWLPETTMPNETFSANLLVGGLGICAEPIGNARIVAVGCVHAVAGAYGTSAGRAPVAEGDRGYAAGTLSAGVRARALGPIHIEAMADAHLPVIRPTILAAQCPPSGFEPPFAALALLAGAGVSIP